MVVEIVGNQPETCSTCGNVASYMLRIVGDINRIGQAQRTKHSCRRHLTKQVDENAGSIVVRKV